MGRTHCTVYLLQDPRVKYWNVYRIYEKTGHIIDQTAPNVDSGLWSGNKLYIFYAPTNSGLWFQNIVNNARVC